VVVDVVAAAIAAVERPDDVLLVAGIDVVGTDEAERLAIPVDRLPQVRRHEDPVTDALDL
jgi:hypothetical protein